MDIPQITLESKRLLLRPFDMNDASTVQKFAGNINVAKTTVNIPHPYEDGMAEAWIETQPKRWKEDELINFAIINKSSNQLMGVIGLVSRKETKAGIGYWIGEPFWNKGFCTEATKVFIDFCFTSLNIENLEAEFLVTNPASGRVIQKAGMRFKTTRIIKDRKGDDALLNVYEIVKTTS